MYQESNSHWLLVVFAEYVCSRMDFYSVSLHASWTHFFRIGQCCMMYYFKENCTVSCVLWLKLLISSLKCIISANWVCKVKGPFKKKKKKCRILKIILCSFFKSWVIGECGCEGYGTQPVKQNITGTCPLLDMLAINTRSQVASANVRVWMQLCVCVKKKKYLNGIRCLCLNELKTQTWLWHPKLVRQEVSFCLLVLCAWKTCIFLNFWIAFLFYALILIFQWRQTVK